MSERKVLNKYYPADYDPSKIPRAKRPKNRQWTIRTMAPFNMRCNTCGEYIYKGKKFNARQEPVEDETYLGLRIWRFYIKCPRCVAEISFKTDPENTDYAMEAGASRNFEALRTAELMAAKEAEEKEEEEKNNPMKMLENRTKQSQREMDMLETLEDLRDINARQARLDLEQVINQHQGTEKERQELIKKLQEEEDEAFIRSVYPKEKRLMDDADDDGPTTSVLPKKAKVEQTNPTKDVPKKKSSIKDILGGAIKKKTATISSAVKPSTSANIETTKTSTSSSTVTSETTVIQNEKTITNHATSMPTSSAAASNGVTPAAVSNSLGLGSLIGAYGSSDSDESE